MFTAICSPAVMMAPSLRPHRKRFWANGATMKRTRKQLRTTAYHEAGHAVIGRVLTLVCGGASIKPDYADATAGFGITGDPWLCIWEWERRGKVRPSQRAVWRARIMTYMAGAEAEQELLGSTAGGDGSDRHEIALMGEELSCHSDWEREEPRLRAMTRMLV